MSTRMISYAEARDLRIKCAMEIYEDSWESIAIAKDEVRARKFLFFAVGALTLAPFLMVANVVTGFLCFAAGVTCFFVSMVKLFGVGEESARLLSRCFADLDRKEPQLIATMRTQRIEGVREEWASPSL